MGAVVGRHDRDIDGGAPTPLSIFLVVWLPATLFVARLATGFYGEGPTPDKCSRPRRDADFEDQLFEARLRLRHWQNA